MGCFRGIGDAVGTAWEGCISGVARGGGSQGLGVAAGASKLLL
jgi:hypothetical protein